MRDPFIVGQICPYPYPTTLVAEQYVSRVFEVDSHTLAVRCANSPYIILLGCAIPIRNTDTQEIKTFYIYISAVAKNNERASIYWHELCHVYEIKVLDIPNQSARHEGWIEYQAPVEANLIWDVIDKQIDELSEALKTITE